MNFSNMESKTFKKGFLVLSLLIGSITGLEAVAPKVQNFDKILNTQDLDTIINEIKKDLQAQNPKAVSRFDQVSKLMLDARDTFLNPSNNELMPIHTAKMERNYAIWKQDIMCNPSYACVKDKTTKLYVKLTKFLSVLKQFNNATNSFLEIGKLGYHMRPYKYLLPSKYDDLGFLIGILKKRLKVC